MSFLDVFLGKKTYSTEQKLLSKEDIDDLITLDAVSSLSSGEEKIVKQAIEQRRLGDGRISLSQIDETLRSLEHQNKISKNDREALFKIFERFFQRKSQL